MQGILKIATNCIGVYFMSDPNQNSPLFPDEECEDLIFMEDEAAPPDTGETWKILIVDDDPEVHKVTKLALRNFTFEGKLITFFSAYSGQESKKIIAENVDIAMIFLDVVMEKDDAGLDVVNYIRTSLKNEFVQIILRTGQPGKCPESVVILNYGINDYKTKTELTKPKLVTAVVTALRTFSEIKKLDSSKAEMERLARENVQLYQQTKVYSQLLEAKVEERTRELKAKEARLAEAQKLAHLGNFEWEFITKKTTWSDELFRILGLDSEQVEPSLEVMHNLIHPDDREFWSKSLAEALASGQDDELEFRVVRPDGSLRYLFVKRQLTKDTSGRVVKLFGTVQDISDRKQTEAALQNALEAAEVANRAKSDFIANMSHELRNPLNGILGYAQILRRDQTATPKQRDGINIIYQCGTHLLTLINDLLDIAKIEAQKMELIPTEFHFPTFLFNIQQIFHLRAEQKQLTFIYQPSTHLPTAIRADEKRLRQILINLLSNAIKFTNTGSVTFKAEVLGNSKTLEENFPSQILNTKSQIPTPRIRFQIEDTGIGMRPEQLSKIFMPFEQVGDSSRKVEGIGLGLAITKNLVSLMGGELFVESTLGEGSIFGVDIDLPLASAEINAASVQSPETIIGFQGETRKILVVDDAFANRSVITNMLEPIGFEIIEAANGQEGIEKATQLKPDLIITNLIMPVMNGLEMTQQLRSIPECQDTLVIASSASVFEIDRQKSREAGCDDFIPKPIQSEELLEKIQNFLGIVWITESLDASTTNNEKNGEIIAPPPSELVALYQVAQIGDIAGVEEEAARIRQLDPQYVAFANRVLQLAQEFEEQEILKLVEHHISNS
jgi:PAS domain S-box-containing protein